MYHEPGLEESGNTRPFAPEPPRVDGSVSETCGGRLSHPSPVGCMAHTSAPCGCIRAVTGVARRVVRSRWTGTLGGPGGLPLLDWMHERSTSVALPAADCALPAATSAAASGPKHGLETLGVDLIVKDHGRVVRETPARCWKDPGRIVRETPARCRKAQAGRLWLGLQRLPAAAVPAAKGATETLCASAAAAAAGLRQLYIPLCKRQGRGWVSPASFALRRSQHLHSPRPER